ncbi:MAG: alpha/beta hydrolase, partial [Leadbetterella sp.]|nr:alpha/beta hydrolase [Leadbetterella sp.]
LEEIYQAYGLEVGYTPGHSFRGDRGEPVFARRYPEKVSHLVLAGAPVSLQQSFRTILETVRKKAEAKSDSATLAQIDFVKKQDTASIYYSSGSFMLAMQNGIYTAENAGEQARQRMEDFLQHPAAKAYMDNLAKTNYKNMYAPTMGFVNKEKYTTIELADDLKRLRGPRLYGIYGKEDGLFDEKQITEIRSLVADPARFLYLDNCSHGVYMDRQGEFINALVSWLK